DCNYLSFKGLTIVSGELPFEFNVLRQSISDFDSEDAAGKDYQWSNYDPAAEKDEAAAKYVLRRKHHINDVPVRDFVEVCIDYRQSGIGGYDSWGATAETERTLWNNRNYEFSFSIVPQSVMDTVKASEYVY
ncbi:MAG: beta-galactosidase, partial [Candidatus Cryptobacteroides sp.]